MQGTFLKPKYQFHVQTPEDNTEERPLTTDERASCAILSLYQLLFCFCSFVYGDSLSLQLMGFAAAVMGAFLFWSAFFHPQAKGGDRSTHPVRSYLFSFFTVLVTLLLLRYLGGLIGNLLISVLVIYIGAALALIIFRKAMVQVITSMLAIMFLIVTFRNWDDIASRQMTFTDTVKQSGLAFFEIAPIQDVWNILISANYMGYLNKIDFRDPQINMVATRAVINTRDDDLRKTRAVLEMVSNDIHYVSDPDDGLEYAKDPIVTLLSGGGDCEDQTLLLCSLLETVGVKTYIAFTDDHVFGLVRFTDRYPDLGVKPHITIDGTPCYAVDPADRGAVLGQSEAQSYEIERVFDVRDKAPVRFEFVP